MENLKFLLVGDNKSRQVDTIDQALNASFSVMVEKFYETAVLDEMFSTIQPDVLIIATEYPSPSTLNSIGKINDNYPVPVIIFAEEQKRHSNIHNVINAGVSAYVVDGLQASRICTIVDIAIARFQQNQGLRKELEKTKNKLQERTLVDRAKGILMHTKGLNEEDAYHTLRKLAMDRSTSLIEMAKNVISLAEVLTSK